jgi:hypothetical protein
MSRAVTAGPVPASDVELRHSGAVRSTEPGISRFRVWSFGPSRNDSGESGASALPRFHAAHPPADSSAPHAESDSIIKQPEAHARIPAARPAPEACEIMSLERSRAQGRPGARNCTHGPRAKKVARARVDHRYRRQSRRPSLRSGFTAYNALSSVNLSVCHRRPHEAWQLRLDLAPDVGAPGPHDFAVRERAARRTASQRPPHSSPRP